MDYTCITALGVLATAFLGLAAMFLNYKAKFDKKSISLEKNDQQHAEKHHHNETRIKTLEEKNGNEQHQIDELREEIKSQKQNKSELKDLIIKLQDRIINCEKNGNHKKRRQDLGEEEN